MESLLPVLLYLTLTQLLCVCRNTEERNDCQHGEGIVTFKKHGIPDSQMCCLICRRSGARLFRWIAGKHGFSPSGRSHKSCDANQR